MLPSGRRREIRGSWGVDRLTAFASWGTAAWKLLLRAVAASETCHEAIRENLWVAGSSQRRRRCGLWCGVVQRL